LAHDELNEQSIADGWKTYWEGVSGSQAFTTGGASHPGFAAFWSGAFGEFFATRPKARTLDIATGSGAVIQSLSTTPGVELQNICCVDIAEAAVDGVKTRFPGVEGVVADANSIPLEAGGFELITSQFGIEYAGPGALDEAVRLLAPDGYLMFLMHIDSGALHQECLAAIDSLRRVREARFFELTTTFFEAGFAAVRGADRAPYDTAAGYMNPVIQELEAIMTQHGEKAADGTIDYLYSTLQKIHSRIQYYEPDEVLNWLKTSDAEVSKYLDRMQSMNACALNKAEIEGIRNLLINNGMQPSQAEPLQFEGDPLPFAWTLQVTTA
jgi:ubiquinone/menaquinone biosynthesis C-methylase UbiE